MTTPHYFIEEHQILTALFDEGLETLHLRKPGTEPVYAERLLSLIPEKYLGRIVVHDHFYLKKEFGLRGVHLGGREHTLPAGYRGGVSCTAYSVAEVKMRKKQVDYVIYSTRALQTDEEGAYDNIRKEVENGALDGNVYAQGFAGLHNISRLKDTGLPGVVILGDIWNRFNIWGGQDFKDVIKHFRNLRRAIE